MNKIKILSDEVINKISAGEVIERPYSVVKELVENSIDAGAKNITIEIKNGGKTFIQIVDDGIGMSKEEALLSLQRYATSKITQFEDLHKLTTLGFRGEALSSVLAVSQFQMMTRLKTQISGTKIEAEANKILKVQEIGMPIGTKIIVKNLFFNTSPRLKFLKSDSTELSHIIHLIEKNALVHNDVYFKLIHNDNVIIDSPADKNILNKFINLFGNEFEDELIFLNSTENEMSLTGLISKPSFSRPNKDYQLFFVNHRPVKDKIISYAVSQVYKDFLQKDEYPIMVLFFNICSDIVDVNVHPTKNEVRFADTNKVYNFIFKSLKEKLLFYDITPDLLKKEKTYKYEIKESIADYYKTTSFDKNIETKKQDTIFQKYGEDFKFITAIQIKNSYIITATNEEIRIIDQHAICERILYEKLMKDYENKNIAIQGLLIPINFTLSYKDSLLLEKNIDLLLSLGFEIEKFGKNNFIIRAVPAILKNVDFKNLIIEIINEEFKEILDLQKRIIIRMSCKGSLKAGTKINNEEIQNILKEIDNLKNPFVCPHNRPTMTKISFNELEKQFKRK